MSYDSKLCQGCPLCSLKDLAVNVQADCSFPPESLPVLLMTKGGIMQMAGNLI